MLHSTLMILMVRRFQRDDITRVAEHRGHGFEPYKYCSWRSEASGAGALLPEREDWIGFCRWYDYDHAVCFPDLNFIDSLKEFFGITTPFSVTLAFISSSHAEIQC